MLCNPSSSLLQNPLRGFETPIPMPHTCGGGGERHKAHVHHVMPHRPPKHGVENFKSIYSGIISNNHQLITT